MENTTYPRLPQVCPNWPGTSQTTSDNSSGYEQTLSNNNMQLTEFNSIIHQQHHKVSSYSGYFICKETRSSVQHSNQVFYFLTNRLYMDHPTRPTNPYLSQCLPPRAHNMDLQTPLQHLLLSILPLLSYLI